MPSGTSAPGNHYPSAGPTGSGGGGSSPSAGSGTGGVSGSTGSAGSTAGSGGSSGTNTGSGSGAGSDCALGLTLALDKSASNGVATYPAGQDPKFIVTARDNGTGNCGIDVSGKGILISVTDTATGATVWSSNVCSGATDERELGPGDSYQGTTAWLRIRSVTGCPENPPSAGTGMFVVTATADGVSAASVQFALQ
jgi:hypothetical protein